MRTNLEDAFTAAELAEFQPTRVERNTFRRETSEGVVIYRLHRTDIVTIWPNGAAQYDSGGWQSATTRQRINAYGPFPVVTVKGVWYVEDAEALHVATKAATNADPENLGEALAYISQRQKLAPLHRVLFRDGIQLPDAFPAVST